MIFITGFIDHGVDVFWFEKLVVVGAWIEVEALVKKSEVVFEFVLFPNSICSDGEFRFIFCPILSYRFS
jgi:hypothetical protein